SSALTPGAVILPGLQQAPAWLFVANLLLQLFSPDALLQVADSFEDHFAPLQPQLFGKSCAGFPDSLLPNVRSESSKQVFRNLGDRRLASNALEWDRLRLQRRKTTLQELL